MQHAKDYDAVFLSENRPQAPYPQPEQATPLAAKGSYIANAARPETIHRVEHSLSIPQR